MQIILFRGRPGVGKTTITNAYIQNRNCCLLRKDDLYDVSSEIVLEHSDRNRISYNGLYKILESNVSSNAFIVLDYPFQHEGDFELIRNWCSKHGVDLKSVLVTCSDKELWSKRLLDRSQNPAPNQLVTSYETFEKMYGTMIIEPEQGELVVDTINDLNFILNQVNEFYSQAD